MDMTLSNNTVARDAARGTVIGTFNFPVKLSPPPSPFFAVEGKNLVVAWDGGPPDLGDHDIRVHTLPTGPRMRFSIHVITAAPPAAKPPAPIVDVGAPTTKRRAADPAPAIPAADPEP